MRSNDGHAVTMKRQALVKLMLPLLAGMVSAVALTGCTRLGPRALTRDRADYSEAVAQSWKQQTLLNIVKLRYMDLPVFMDVSQVVSGYSLETSANVGGQISSSGAIQGNSLLLGGASRYTDRPTISYAPMTGEKFLRGMITPIDPKHIFFMLQAGYPADFILGLMVDSLNGVRNRTVAADGVREADPDFVRVLQLMRAVQREGAVGIRIETSEQSGEVVVMFFRQHDLSEETQRELGEIRRLLRIPEETSDFRLVYSPVRGTDKELAVGSRSMLQIMTALASYSEVPPEHVAEGRVIPIDAARTGSEPAKIHCSTSEPESPFVAVRYRDHWFWIDDTDLRTKRAFTAIMFFFTLAETGNAGALPLITIPAQ